MSLNVEGGLGRVVRGLRIVGKVWGWGVLLITAIALAFSIGSRGGDALWFTLGFGVLVAVVPASIALGLAWLIEGFLQPKQ